jgi:hypothetical protein
LRIFLIFFLFPLADTINRYNVWVAGKAVKRVRLVFHRQNPTTTNRHAIRVSFFANRVGLADRDKMVQYKATLSVNTASDNKLQHSLDNTHNWATHNQEDSVDCTDPVTVLAVHRLRDDKQPEFPVAAVQTVVVPDNDVRKPERIEHIQPEQDSHLPEEPDDY